MNKKITRKLSTFHIYQVGQKKGGFDIFYSILRVYISYRSFCIYLYFFRLFRHFNYSWENVEWQLGLLKAKIAFPLYYMYICICMYIAKRMKKNLHFFQHCFSIFKSFTCTLKSKFKRILVFFPLNAKHTDI